MQRNTYHRQVTLNKEIRHSNKILLNTLPTDVINRRKKNDFPVSYKYEQATIAAVDIVFASGGNYEDYLVALDEIFCVS